MKTLTTLIILAIVTNSHQRSTPESDSYVAAVVEFAPTGPTTPGKPPTRDNTVKYVDFIEKAAKQDADIIVFPEGGLTTISVPVVRSEIEEWTTIIPSPSRDFIPCINSAIPVIETLTVISCSARQNGIYVVINIDEKVICLNDTCPRDKRLYYNTNVVFDREGKIIARYRKTNLFNEIGFNVTKTPELVTFDTDFGVTFGTFICFDILFKHPGMYLTRMLNVTDVVYTTAWFSEVPFLTALQIQASWSYAEDVNFLASGYNRPKFGSAGSGIYLGRQGIAKATIPLKTTSEILVAKVQKKNRALSTRKRPPYTYDEDKVSPPIEDEEHNVHDELRRKRSLKVKALHDKEDKEDAQEEQEEISLLHEDLSSYSYAQLNSSIAQTLCHGEFCCGFNIELLSVDPTSKYFIVAFNGTRGKLARTVTIGIKVCAVVQCSNDSLTFCGILDETETIFGSLTINATFPDYEDVLILPTSLETNLHPLPNWTYMESYEGTEVRVTANLDTLARNVVTCGIYVRIFSRDIWDTDEKDSTSSMQWATLTALAIVSLFLLFLYRKGWRKPWQRNDQLSSQNSPYQQLQHR